MAFSRNSQISTVNALLPGLDSVPGETNEYHERDIDSPKWINDDVRFLFQPTHNHMHRIVL